jgi:hypothetical protein
MALAVPPASSPSVVDLMYPFTWPAPQVHKVYGAQKKTGTRGNGKRPDNSFSLFNFPPLSSCLYDLKGYGLCSGYSSGL